MPTTSIVVRKRVAGLFLLTVVAFFLLAGRLAWLQLVKGEELRRRALEARMRDVPVEARRGTICDRHGRELAVSVSVESCYAFPPQVKKPKETAARLAPLLKMDEARLEALLTQQQAFVWLKRKLEPEVTREIKALRLPGIGFVEESRRFYPQHTLAAHVLGYVGIDNQGLGGVEYALEKELQGERGRIVIEHDALGRAVPDALHYYIPAQQGHDVLLTIDQTVQYFVERELDKIVATYQPRYAVIIVMDPRTGEILGMGSRPTFDPAQYQEVASEVRDRNPAVWYNYEPGSTFKIVTLAAALEEHVVNENSRFFDPGYIKVADRWIRCWYDGGHGSQTLAEVVQNSCNPGFIQIALDLGRERFYKYVRAFGFGHPTGVGLPGEAEGLLIPEEKATNLNVATMAIGQSIAVTPLQLLSAVAAVANGGVLMRPQIVKVIRSRDGKVLHESHPEAVRQVISRETARQVTALLEGVIVKGTGRNAFLETYRAAGKTGTAQVVGAGGGYVQGRYVSSFVGFAPVQDPRVAILVMVAEPQGGVYYGSIVAAPAFKAVARDVLRYLGVPEEVGLERPRQVWPPPEVREEVEVPQVVNMAPEEARRLLAQAGLGVRVRGEGNVVSLQMPVGGVKVLKGTAVVLELGPRARDGAGEVTLPDLTGLSIKEVGRLLEQMQLQLEAEGSGVAVRQSIPPGQRVPRGTTVHVEFAPPSAQDTLASPLRD